MLVIKKSCDEMREMLYEAKERADMAIEYKAEYPLLASTLIDISNNILTNVDKLHSAIVSVIEKEKTKSEVPQEMLELWKYEHKIYIEKYEKVKMRIALYQKI